MDLGSLLEHLPTYPLGFFASYEAKHTHTNTNKRCVYTCVQRVVYDWKMGHAGMRST